MIYELREYTAHDHTTPQLHDRFAATVLPLFVEHGLDVVGFWTDADDGTKILYLLRFDDAEAQAGAWSGFHNDSQWKTAKCESEADGPIVAHMASRNLIPVPYWPAEGSTDREGC